MHNNICIKFTEKKYFLILFFIFLIFNEAKKLNFERTLLRFINHNKRNIIINGQQACINSVVKYIDLISNGNISYIHYDYEINKPKITFIATVFNKEKYLTQLIVSIQNQMLEEFEIIFIDDCSSDKSIKIINKFLKIDKRIKLIKNKKNKGTLYSRSQGALHSKGEYVIFIDSDDLILQKGLFNSYNYIKLNNLSMVQFNAIFKRKESLSLSIRYYKYRKIIRQPYLSYIFFYNENTQKGDELNTALWDKLLSRNLAIKTINFIGEKYYKEIIKIENDVILLFSLFQMADSYQYINEIGYFYIRNNNDSITNTWTNLKNADSIIHGIFTNIKFFYEKTGNTYLDKYFCLFKLQQAFKRYIICFVKSHKQYRFIKNVFQLLLNSIYISDNDKIILSNIEITIINLMFS